MQLEIVRERKVAIKRAPFAICCLFQTHIAQQSLKTRFVAQVIEKWLSREVDDDEVTSS
jgi:hypothetical protein